MEKSKWDLLENGREVRIAEMLAEVNDVEFYF